MLVGEKGALAGADQAEGLEVEEADEDGREDDDEDGLRHMKDADQGEGQHVRGRLQGEEFMIALDLSVFVPHFRCEISHALRD